MYNTELMKGKRRLIVSQMTESQLIRMEEAVVLVVTKPATTFEISRKILKKLLLSLLKVYTMVIRKLAWDRKTRTSQGCPGIRNSGLRAVSPGVIPVPDFYPGNPRMSPTESRITIRNHCGPRSRYLNLGPQF